MAHTRHVLKDLDQEWEVLARSAGSNRQLRAWAGRHDCFTSVGDLPTVVTRIRRGGFDESNDLVWALLELAVDDPLAVRTVLQALIPGLGGELGWLLAWARRTDPAMVDGGDVDQLLIAAAMEAIRHAAGKRKPWPLSSILRRTHRVLRRDVVAEDRWRMSMVLSAEPRMDDTADVEPTPAELLTTVLDEARDAGAVSASDAELVWLTRVGGFQPVELAERFGANGDCLRRRRQRAEARLIDLAVAV